MRDIRLDVRAAMARSRSLHAVVPCPALFRIRAGVRAGHRPPAVPVLPGPGQPQRAGTGLSLGHERRGMGGHRAAAARAGLDPGPGGCPGSYCRRDIVNAIRYLTYNGPVWRAMPADLPYWRTVYHCVRTWQKTGASRRMHDALREQVRVQARRGPQPSAAIIDSQSVRAAETVGKASSGWSLHAPADADPQNVALAA
jgi:transposase